MSVTVSLCLRDFSKNLRYIFNFVKRQTQDQAAVCIIFKIIVGEVHGGRQSNPGRHGKLNLVVHKKAMMTSTQGAYAVCVLLNQMYKLQKCHLQIYMYI